MCFTLQSKQYATSSYSEAVFSHSFLSVILFMLASFASFSKLGFQFPVSKCRVSNFLNYSKLANSRAVENGDHGLS